MEEDNIDFGILSIDFIIACFQIIGKEKNLFQKTIVESSGVTKNIVSSQIKNITKFSSMDIKSTCILFYPLFSNLLQFANLKVFQNCLNKAG